AGILVLAAALAASAAERRHEAALLRTLGARRAQLRVAAACEFAMLGLVAGSGGVPHRGLRAAGVAAGSQRGRRRAGGDAAGTGRHAPGQPHATDAPAARGLSARGTCRVVTR